LNLPFFIAKRYLVSKKSTNAINIISGISVIAITLGAMALVIILSAFNGLSGVVQSLFNSFNPDLVITVKQGKTFDPSAEEIRMLRKDPSVAHYTEIVEGNALLKYNDKQCIATIKGVSAEFNKMSGFDTLVRDGNFDLSGNNVVMGKGIAYILQTSANEMFNPISVYAPKRGKTNSLNPEEGLNELKIYPAGLFTINDDFDYKYVIMDIAKARELLDFPAEVTSLELGLKPGGSKEAAQASISRILGDKYTVKNKEQQNALLYKTLKTEKLWTFIILVFILVIATFNLIGSLTMLIIEKKKDIGILYNMGADLRLIRRIFLFEGLLITFIGAVSGLILGFFVCWLQIRFSLVKLSEGYVIDAYPIAFKAIDILLVFVVVMLIGLFAAWYPVRLFTRKHLFSFQP
jgi:lipoprotein-releasing system permease protein